MTAEWRFCREASVAREEPLLGTASTVRRWILVERNGPWGVQALRDSRLGDEASARLRAIARANGARGLLIRRHGRYEQEGFRVMVAFTGRRRRWLEELFFDDLETLLAHDYSPLRRGRSVGGERVDDLRFFVCTHGKHDPCCARYGRRVADALHQAMPHATWETSHIGGDRFAGNVLILPLGFYYGRVDEREALRLAQELRAGRIDLDHFRGRSCYPFAAQAAEWLARERLSLLGVDDLALEGHEELADHRYRTSFDTADGRRVVVDVEVARADAVHLTCHADRAAAAPCYRLLDLEVSDRGAPSP